MYQRRGRAGVPVVALVGYTNAGKTRLLNSLTKGQQDLRSEDRLFCTLDTKMRQLRLPSGLRCVLMDSVGFIQVRCASGSEPLTTRRNKDAKDFRRVSSVRSPNSSRDNAENRL